MKTIISFLFLLTLSTAAFAQGGGNSADRGGQTGSGGNGCMYQTLGGEIAWTSIEEMIYRRYFSVPWTGSVSDDGGPEIHVSKPGKGKIGYMNVPEGYKAKRILARVKNATRRLPHVQAVLADLYQLFDRVQVVNGKLSGIFNGDLQRVPRYCKSFEPAMVTLDDSSVVIFYDTWKNLDVMSQEIIFVHETLRLAQLFHPAFKDMSNKMLQEATALMFLSYGGSHDLKTLLAPIEAKLSAGSYEMKPVTNFSSPSHKLAYDTISVWNRGNKEQGLGTVLNQLRHSAEFTELTEKHIKEALMSK